MRAWFDGQLLTDPEQPVVRLSDHGFTVGDGVFEAVKVVDGRPFALGLHLDRLERSAVGLGLGTVDRAAVEKGVADVLAAEHLPLGRLRITVTDGPGPLGSGRSDGPQSVAVVAVPMAAGKPETSVVTVPWTRNERGATAGLKTTSYAENVIALAYARERGATEAVLANTAGHLCEGTGSNVFYVVDGELRTPSLASGCLAGVTRALVLEWCGGREVDEPIGVAEAADEVFLVSTTRDVQAVTRWGSRELEVGPVTRAAAETWARREPEMVGL
ncbi:aminotransferase class IV [Nocardioides sp. GY 10127]|uniref:aminotransferase class IV n=1 Tax=Nocardioides sp. GY 10127 TaxID=2569762 RepID=UPI0010A7F01B|nr:aminotransferase class IV [Nocardioides sp. GY 10127]TIC85541.1 4-amino-4-deoxychorismate lyase [Nocardioides sp. GY 10127]